MLHKLLIILTSAALVTGSCKKSSDTHLSNAVITGYDYRKCSCCGGLMINFDNDPVPYQSTFKLVRNLPANAGISEQSSFPMYVRVAWQPVTGGCGDRIDIVSLEKK